MSPEQTEIRDFKPRGQYRFLEGHRSPNHTLFYLGEVESVPYKDKKMGPAKIFVCGTEQGILARQGITIVEVPKDMATAVKIPVGKDGKAPAIEYGLNVRPEQCGILEFGNYNMLLHGPETEREKIAPIEQMLLAAGFENRSNKPTPINSQILAQIGTNRKAKAGA